MDTYRDRIRAYRRLQTTYRRADMRDLRAARASGNRSLALLERIMHCKAEIDRVMYAPYPPWADQIAPPTWHPGGPGLDGSRLVEQWG